MIYIAHTNTTIAADGELHFRFWLAHHLDSFGFTIERFVLPDDPQNIYDMFRELKLTFGEEVNVSINELTKRVAMGIAENSTYETLKHTFQIPYNEDSYRTCYLIFKYDKAEKMFFYEKFGLIYSDEEKERINKLGLKKNNPIEN